MFSADDSNCSSSSGMPIRGILNFHGRLNVSHKVHKVHKVHINGCNGLKIFLSQSRTLA